MITTSDEAAIAQLQAEQNKGAEGLRNSDLSASASWYMEGGSWKPQRIITIFPTGKNIHCRVVLSWLSLIYPPNQAQWRILTDGMEVGEAYSSAFDQILANPIISNWEYVLTIEHDNIPPADGVLKLVRRMEQNKQFACIGGLYWTKFETGVPQIWGDPKDPVPNYRPQTPVPGQLVECCATGMGFNLWRLSMFKDKRFPRPLFKTVWNATEGCSTQDMTFWKEARKLGYRCAIDCDVLVGHMDTTSGIIW